MPYSERSIPFGKTISGVIIILVNDDSIMNKAFTANSYQGIYTVCVLKVTGEVITRKILSIPPMSKIT